MRSRPSFCRRTPGRLALFQRQWCILRALATRRYVTVSTLADEHGTTERTISRDLQALMAAGFALYDETISDGETWRKVWRLTRSVQQNDELRAILRATA